MPEKTLRESLSATLQCIGFGDDQRSTVVQVGRNNSHGSVVSAVGQDKTLSVCGAVQAFAQDGLRTLCLAVKRIDPATFDEWRVKHHEARSVLHRLQRLCHDTTSQCPGIVH